MPEQRFSISEREYRLLYTLYVECRERRRLGLQQFNRLSPMMRLAFVELEALYGEGPLAAQRDG